MALREWRSNNNEQLPSLTFEKVGYKPGLYFQSLFVYLQKSDWLVELRRILCRTLEVTNKDFMPHLSLMYRLAKLVNILLDTHIRRSLAISSQDKDNYIVNLQQRGDVVAVLDGCSVKGMQEINVHSLLMVTLSPAYMSL